MLLWRVESSVMRISLESGEFLVVRGDDRSILMNFFNFSKIFCLKIYLIYKNEMNFSVFREIFTD